MFCENLKSIRKAKGLTQAELAVHLNVVRQTISKWEKGLSVPDAEMLIDIAEVLEVSVSDLLENKTEDVPGRNDLAEKVSRNNAPPATKPQRGNLIFKIVLAVMLGIMVLNIFLIALGAISFKRFKDEKNVTLTEQYEIISLPT